MIQRQLIQITGATNQITYDSGLSSTQTEKKRLLSVSLVVDAIQDNQIQGYHERAKVFDIPDRLIDYELKTTLTDNAKPGARINDIEVGLDIPVGETFKLAIKCGATASNVYGTYNYELAAA